MEKSREKKRHQVFKAKMRMRKFRALKKIKRRMQCINNDELMFAMNIADKNNDNLKADLNERLYGDACNELEPPCSPLPLQCTEVMEVFQVKTILIIS